MESPRRRPVHDGIDEALIATLVRAFYAKVRADDGLGPIFDRAIGEGWEPHLAKMCDFWSSVTMLTGRYKGNPMMAHMRLKTVRPEHFARWLELFEETAGEVCAPEVAAVFIARARNIAQSLQLGMFFRPQETGRAAPGAAG